MTSGHGSVAFSGVLANEVQQHRKSNKWIGDGAAARTIARLVHCRQPREATHHGNDDEAVVVTM